MWITAISALLLGLAGNLHCLGMCGPIAMALPVHNRGTLYKFSGLTGYNAGRLVTYSILGLLFGLFGRGLAMAGLQRYLSVISGIIMMLILLLPGMINRFQFHSWLGKIKGAMHFFLHRKSIPALFTLGLVNGLLPCGLVYIALTASLATGNAYTGALFMALFGLATMPGMFTVGYVSGVLKEKNKRSFRLASPVFTVIVALVLILRGLNLGIPYLSPKISTPYEKASCCHR